MKCNSAQKRTVCALSVIQQRWSGGKEFVKNVQKLLNAKNNNGVITHHKQSIFEHSYV